MLLLHLCLIVQEVLGFSGERSLHFLKDPLLVVLLGLSFLSLFHSIPPGLTGGKNLLRK